MYTHATSKTCPKNNIRRQLEQMMFWVKNHMVQRDVPVGHHMTYHVIYGVQMTKNRTKYCTKPCQSAKQKQNDV